MQTLPDVYDPARRAHFRQLYNLMLDNNYYYRRVRGLEVPRLRYPLWFRVIAEDDGNLWPNHGNPPDSDDDDDDSEASNSTDSYPMDDDDDDDDDGEGGHGNNNDPPPQNAALPDSTTDPIMQVNKCASKRKSSSSPSESEMPIRKVLRVSIEDAG